MFWASLHSESLLACIVSRYWHVSIVTVDLLKFFLEFIFDSIYIVYVFSSFCNFNVLY